MMIEEFSTNDSALPYVFTARRKGRGWVYRRRWWDGRPSRWLSTSDRGLRLILDLQEAR